jgi:hypothetical protein
MYVGIASNIELTLSIKIVSVELSGIDLYKAYYYLAEIEENREEFATLQDRLI